MCVLYSPLSMETELDFSVKLCFHGEQKIQNTILLVNEVLILHVKQRKDSDVIGHVTVM